MRQSSNSGRRLRGRPNRNKNHGGTPNRNSTFESNGPEGKVRGNATQVFEKYLALAREASASGNRVGAEAFYQHAEHYFRIMNDSTDPRQEGQQSQSGGRDGQRQPYRNGADGDGQGRTQSDSPSGDDDQGEEAGAASPRASLQGEQPGGEAGGEDRPPRARTPRDQLRRGRGHRNQGGDASRNLDGRPGPNDGADTRPQDAKGADTPEDAKADGVQNPAAEGAANGTEGEAQNEAPRRGRGRKAAGDSDGERAPRRGRPRKAKTADPDESAPGESGDSAA